MITSLISAAKALNSIFENGGKMENNDIKVKTFKNRSLLLTNGSLTNVLGKYIIEPKIVVSRSLKNHEQVEKVIEMNIDIFTAFYTRVFKILGNIHEQKIETVVELLSSKSEDYTSLAKIGFESYDNLLVNLESDDGIIPLKSNGVELDVSNEALEKSAVAKMILREVVIKVNAKNQSGDKYAIEIPILVRAAVVYSDVKNINRMLTVNDRDKSFWNRLDDYRAGSISLSDMIFASDLIKDYKEKRLSDNDDLIKDMEERSRTANTKLATDGVVGFNKYYQMIIVSGDDKILLERTLKGKLSKDKFKEAFLEQSKSLTLTTLDDDYERSVFYIKDLKGGSDVSYKSLSKPGNKNNEVLEVLKFVMGNQI